MGITVNEGEKDGRRSSKKSETKKIYKTNKCSRCGGTNIGFTDNQVVCLDCHDWAYFDDAINSCWLTAVSQYEKKMDLSAAKQIVYNSDNNILDRIDEKYYLYRNALETILADYEEKEKE